MLKTQSVVVDNYELDCRKKYLLFFGIVESSKLQRNEWNEWISTPEVRRHQKFVNWDLDWRNQACSYWEIWVWLLRELKGKSVLHLSEKLWFRRKQRIALFSN